MSESDKKEEVIALYEMITIVNNLGSPINFFDTESNKNLDEKLKILQKMFMGKELTKEERFNKRVFEKLPHDADKMILN